MNTLSALLLALGIAAVGAPAIAQDAPPAKKQAVKKTAKHAAPAHKESAATDEDDKEPDVSSYATANYDCELGNKLSIYRNAEDNNHIALRWKKQLLRLTRVQTTTGANRFENRKNGWVWIDIPTKGMLLDAKKGQQLANECKHPEQMPKAEASKS
jgi:hypothetical protein